MRFRLNKKHEESHSDTIQSSVIDSFASDSANGEVPSQQGPSVFEERKKRPPLRLGDLLIQKGVISSDQLARAILAQSESGRKLGELLVDLDMADEKDIVDALALQLGLENAGLSREAPDESAAKLLPENDARRLHAIPIRFADDGVVIVAVSNPTPDLERELHRILQRPMRMALASSPEIQWALDHHHRALEGVESHIASYIEAHAEEIAAAASSVNVETGGDDDSPVVRVVNMIIIQAMRDRASDVHIEPQQDVVRVRFRIDGKLQEVLELPNSIASALVSRIKVLAGMNIVERRRPQDGQIQTTIDGHRLDVRVATIGTLWGEKVVMRILDKRRSLLKLKQLGMAPDTHDKFEKMLRSPYGMVVCAGPTGSGKTTTLYASLNQLNDTDKNITTIEDPVEYVFPHINQIQINKQAGVTFAAGLRSILRQDPDVILVGEIRDEETADITIQSTLTGHFVLSSIHATDAVSTMFRFLDMGIEPFLIASSLLGVVGQRLVRRICDDCRAPYEPTKDELQYFLESGGKPDTTFSRGQGCNYCNQTGYADRVGVYELLEVTENLRTLLVQPNVTQAEIRELARKEGLRTMREEGVRLVEEGVTTIHEIIAKIYTM